MGDLEVLRKIVKNELYLDRRREVVPPADERLRRAFLMLNVNRELPDHIKPVAKYFVEKPNGTVSEIYKNLSNKLEQNYIERALAWLDYYGLMIREADKYSVDSFNLKVLKDYSVEAERNSQGNLNW